jgi:hypothetical protein
MFKYFCLSLLLLCSISAMAQNESNSNRGKFKQENIFMGTGLNVGFANRTFNLGINPEIGYSITKWLDAGIVTNLNYYSQSPIDINAYKYQKLSYGAGSFIRIWPVNFFHIQIQPEFNWINSAEKSSVTGTTYKSNYNAGSLMVGIGYGSHSLGSRYSYVTLMMDVLEDAKSPYRDQFNDPLPVFRAGFGVYLKPRKQ